MFLIISIVFTLLHWICAFGLIIFSVHGPSSLPAMTLFWLIAIQVILWAGFIIFRKSKNRHAAVYLVFIGILTTASAPMIYFLADKYDSYRWNNIITKTKIYDMRDELLLTGEGLPFGIKLSFKAEFPYTDYNYVTPIMRPQSDRYGTSIGPNDMRVLHYSATPALKRDYYFKKGVAYDIVFDMVPGYLIPKQNQNLTTENELQPEFCLQYPIENVHTLTRDTFEEMITVDNPDNYQVILHGTGYGNIYSGRDAVLTHNQYNPAVFFKTYTILNIDECRLSSQ
jgi:hypothetical protein